MSKPEVRIEKYYPGILEGLIRSAVGNDDEDQYIAYVTAPSGEEYSGVGLSEEEAEEKAMEVYRGCVNEEDEPDDDCFIATACISALGRSKSCTELSTLKLFRDTYLKQTENGVSLLREYAVIGPDLVSRINTRADALELHRRNFDELVRPCCEMIANLRYEEAISHYVSFVRNLDRMLS